MVRKCFCALSCITACSLVPLVCPSYPPACPSDPLHILPPPPPLQEDEDDPFYMPMMPNMVKWAEASKFSTLARPLGPEEASPFMIAMEPGVCAGGS